MHLSLNQVRAIAALVSAESATGVTLNRSAGDEPSAIRAHPVSGGVSTAHHWSVDRDGYTFGPLDHRGRPLPEAEATRRA